MKFAQAYIQGTKRCTCPDCNSEISVIVSKPLSWTCTECEAAGIGFRSPKELYESVY